MNASPNSLHPEQAFDPMEAVDAIEPARSADPPADAAGLVERRPDGLGACLPFGPYAGQAVAAVSVMDPNYLLALVREGVGPAELRAEAARALALRGRLGPWPGRGVTRAAGSGWAAWGIGAAIGLLLLLALVARGDRAGPSSGAASGGIAGADGGRAAAPARDRVVSKGSSAPGPSGAAAGGTGVAQPQGAGLTDGGAPTGYDPAAPCGARLEGAIPAESAADFLDTFQAVEFEVVGTKDTGRVTFLNSHDPYPGHFYVAIFPDDYAAFPEHPARHFNGRCVVIQGSIEAYRGTPQIVLREAEDIRIVEPQAAVDGP